jgi:hypothetical protein
MPLSKIFVTQLALCALLLQSAGSVSAQGTPAEKPVLRSAKERGAAPQADSAGAAGSSGLTREQRVTICLETWDAQTHMTRREWRIACERSVLVEPGIFR